MTARKQRRTELAAEQRRLRQRLQTLAVSGASPASSLSGAVTSAVPGAGPASLQWMSHRSTAHQSVSESSSTSTNLSSASSEHGTTVLANLTAPPTCSVTVAMTVSVCLAFLFFFMTDSTDSPDCLPILFEHIRFLLFSFSVFHFLVVGFRTVD